MKIANTALELVGNTPLVRLNRLAKDCAAEVIAKLEFYAPGASVKDRIGVAMIEAAEKVGAIGPNTILGKPVQAHHRRVADKFKRCIGDFHDFLNPFESLSDGG